MAVAKKVGTGNWIIYNIFRDNLGTITQLKDMVSGTVTEYSFDAWGRRRDANDWTTTLTNEPALFADRGFTGHEYLEDFKLYNMNGRLYDPVVGRFLSPDPFIQDPANTQSYNRYSYCLNNPLTLNDPSGYKWNWNWLNPMYWFVEGMQAINDNTKGVRREMQKMHFPDFNVGGSINSNGNVYFKGDIRGHEVFNTENYAQFKGGQDAIQNFVNMTVPNLEARYGKEWRAPNSQALEASSIIGIGGLVGDFASMSSSSFRLMSGANGTISPKIYSSGWKGGSAARITTYSLSKVGTGVSFGASAVTTFMAYNDIYEGKYAPLTYVDAGVGTVGTLSSLAYYYSRSEIPYVGEAVFIYGTARLTWDVFYYLGANYGPIGAYYGTNKWSGR